MTMPETKTCRACGVEKARTEFYDRHADCRACVYASRKSHRVPLDDRFWSKVDKAGPTQPHMDTPCWVWTSCLLTSGYGKFWFRGGNVGAHRVAWELTHGAIADGVQVLHRCDNRLCVRPDHLYLGSHADNMRDMADRGRAMAGDQHPARARPETRPRGSEHGGAILAEYDIVAMVDMCIAEELTASDLGSRFDIGESTVKRILRGTAWSGVVAPERLALARAARDRGRRAKRPRGTEQRSAKLNDAKVRAIRALHSAGNTTLTALASEYHVDRSVIADVVYRRTWKGVL